MYAADTGPACQAPLDDAFQRAFHITCPSLHQSILDFPSAAYAMSVSSSLPEARPIGGSGSMRRQLHRKSASGLVPTSNQDGSLHTLICETARKQDSGSIVEALLTELDHPASAAAAYLSSLTTQSLASLRSQPELLASSSSQINDQLASLCLRQVSSLVEIHSSTAKLPFAVDSIQSSVDGLVKAILPELSRTAANFVSRSQQSLTKGTRSRKLIEAHAATLPDLLDVPDLIEACIRAGYHDQAVELGAHITKLARSDSPLGGGLMLNSVKIQAWSSLRGMRDQIFRLLEAKTLRISEAKRLVSSLRRLEEIDGIDDVDESWSRCYQLGLSEDQLCLAFLRARAHVLEELLASPLEAQRLLTVDLAETGDGAQHLAAAQLAAFIDVWRQVVSETCRMASSLFLGSAILSKTLSAFILRHAKILVVKLSDGVSDLVEQARPTAAPNTSNREVTRSVEELASTLLSLHSQLSLASQSMSIWGASLIHLSLSLEPVSFDFCQTAIGNLPFAPASLEVLRIPCIRALKIFTNELPSPTGHLPSAWLCKDQSQRHVFDLKLSTPTNEISPQIVQLLAHFPLLARLCNDTLIGINAMRTFAPVSMSYYALDLLDHHLMEACNQLSHYCARLPNSDLVSSSIASALELPSLGEEGNDMVDAKFSTSTERRMQAERLLGSQALRLLLYVLTPYLRQSLWTSVMSASATLPPLSEAEWLTTTCRWIEETAQAWQQGEILRRNRVEASRLHNLQEAEARSKAEQEAIAPTKKAAEQEANAREVTVAKAEAQSNEEMLAREFIDKRTLEQSKNTAEADKKVQEQSQRETQERLDLKSRERKEREAEELAGMGGAQRVDNYTQGMAEDSLPP